MTDWQFALTIQVGEADIDEMGHANNVAILGWVERIARAHAESVGLDLAGFRGFGGHFVVRSHAITYHREANFGDVLRAHTRIRRVHGVRAVREVVIYRGEDLLTDCTTEWIWLDLASGRPKRVPAGLTELLPPFEAMANG